jgi:predicted nucleic acid-binding protein
MQSPVSRIYFDANIFILMFEKKDSIALQISNLLVKNWDKNYSTIVTSDLTFAETLVHPYRQKDEQLIQIYENWSISNSHLEIGPINKEVLYCAAVLRATYKSLKLPDAIHLATAFLSECTHFLSDDTRLKSEYQLINHRFGITRGPLKLTVIRPTAENLSALIEGTL